MIARVAIAIVLSAGTMAGPMRAQAPSAPERVGPALLPAERIASLPAAARDAWTAYIAASERLHAGDTAAMGAERRAARQDAFVRAPYAAADFTYFDRSETWLQSDSARMVADAVLTFQTRSGGWSKRTDMRHPRATAMSFYSETTDWHYTPTFDNGATTGQLRFLARIIRTTADPRYEAAYLRGMALLLAAQQPNGCWPQSFPLEGGYHDAVTFNDDVTVLVLTTLDEAASGRITILAPAQRERAATAARRGVMCLLATQVRVSGKRTVWGQQHDPISLQVVPARSYELAGLAGRESAAILSYLMKLSEPDGEVVDAVHAAAAWFQAHAIAGRRYDSYGVRADTAAPLVWARLTELSTGLPIFANRDGVRLYDWNQLTDRRSGYGWFGSEPARTLQQYAKWAVGHPARTP